VKAREQNTCSWSDWFEISQSSGHRKGKLPRVREELLIEYEILYVDHLSGLMMVFLANSASARTKHMAKMLTDFDLTQ
jgi:hypothetical protein